MQVSLQHENQNYNIVNRQKEEKKDLGEGSVPNSELEAITDEIGGHGLSHYSQTQESHLHIYLFSLLQSPNCKSQQTATILDLLVDINHCIAKCETDMAASIVLNK